MRITHNALFVGKDFAEYEHTERSGDARGSYKKCGYRRRLTNNGIYKRGERYGNYTMWGSEFHDRFIIQEIVRTFDEAVKQSPLYKILHDV